MDEDGAEEECQSVQRESDKGIQVNAFVMHACLFAGKFLNVRFLENDPKVRLATGSYHEQSASLLGARTLLGAPGIATRSILTTSNKSPVLFLLVRGLWPRRLATPRMKRKLLVSEGTKLVSCFLCFLLFARP